MPADRKTLQEISQPLALGRRVVGLKTKGGKEIRCGHPISRLNSRIGRELSRRGTNDRRRSAILEPILFYRTKGAVRQIDGY